MRPSGIQRLEVELCRALVALPQSKGRVFFVRHDARQQCLVAIPWETVEALYNLMTGGSPTELKATSLAAWVRSAVEMAIRPLSPGLRKVVLLQIEVLICVS